MRRSGAPVRQITTGTVCHLDAEMVGRALDGWPLADLDCLFIENVGNLVCPASYDLGEHLRVVLLSVTEGEDKPLKYPTIFNSADAAVVTKIDLADAVGFDHAALLGNIERVRPGMPVLAVSSRTACGFSSWMALVSGRISEAQVRTPIHIDG
ncbi:MAG TPA: hydrogenase nickel incorporation protein HypB [Vicinamibacterales bacterium]|nr:hydrogenase nickel incorporation protein HypB [Vicinamibacterales bacterium]